MSTARELRRGLGELERPTSPFATAVIGMALARVRWVEPLLVVQVAFSHWTADGKLRHPSFQGVRQDKPAREVRKQRERE